jgi:hypothetical protein
MKVAPSDVPLPAQMQREGPLQEMSQATDVPRSLLAKVVIVFFPRANEKRPELDNGRKTRPELRGDVSPTEAGGKGARVNVNTTA